MITSTYNPIIDTCIVLHTRRGLVNAMNTLMVDVMLLLTMSIGLPRYASSNSTGIWKLLYQQCIIWLALALVVETPVVVLPFAVLGDTPPAVLQVLLTLNLNGVFFSSHARAWTEADRFVT